MQRIVVVTAALAIGAMVFSSGALAQAKKGKVNCSVDACVTQCNKVGGNTRTCPAYCNNQISQRKAAGQC